MILSGLANSHTLVNRPSLTDHNPLVRLRQKVTGLADAALRHTRRTTRKASRRMDPRGGTFM